MVAPVMKLDRSPARNRAILRGFVGRADLSERGRCAKRLGDLLAHRSHDHLATHYAERDRVDADVGRRELGCPRADEEQAADPTALRCL
jgi:hypothetical protein